MTSPVMHMSMGAAATQVTTFLSRAAADKPDDAPTLAVYIPQ